MNSYESELRVCRPWSISLYDVYPLFAWKTTKTIYFDRDQEPFNNKREADKFEMEMNGDENHDNRRCICNYPCSRCSSCRFSFSGNDSNLFFALKRFINVTCNRKKRKRRRTETNCEKKLSDFNCGLISETFKTFYMSFCQKMKVVRQQTQNYSMLKHQTSSKVTYTIFFALLLSLQIR